MSRIGFAGLGRMGVVMAPRLVGAGERLTVWNRTAAKAAPLAEAGAEVAPSPRALAEASDVVFDITADDDAATAMFEGPDGLLAGEVSGKLFVEMSTLRPWTTQALAKACAAKGARFVECPVLGTVGPAREGKLLMIAGGPPSDVAEVEPLLLKMGRRVFHAGEVGAGAHMKLAANLMVALHVQALGEAMALVSRSGGDRDLFLDLVSEGPVGTHYLHMRREVLAGATPDPAAVVATIGTVRKDLLSITAACGLQDVPAPAAAAAAATFSAACAAGWTDRDFAELGSFVVDEMPRPKPA